MAISLADKITIWSTSVQALSTVVLVFVTVLSLVQTKKTVKSMDDGIKADFLPILQLTVWKKQSSSKKLVIDLNNVGKGIAKRPVVVTFPGVKSIVLNSIIVGETQNATIIYDTDYILEIPEKDRKICIEYHDVFNRKFATVADLIEVNDMGENYNEKAISWETWTPIMPH